jgi:hypothetical protein
MHDFSQAISGNKSMLPVCVAKHTYSRELKSKVYMKLRALSSHAYIGQSHLKFEENEGIEWFIE